MLTEQRFERILERLKVKKSITVAEITEDLGISESTARRDITALDKAGKLTKVFGGAVAAEHTYEMTDSGTKSERQERGKDQNRTICGRYDRRQ